jgi:enoyl-CoA hydratase
MAQGVAAGFVDQIVPAEALEATLQGQVQRLLKLDAAAFAGTKLRLRRHTLAALRQAIDDDVAGWKQRLAAA